MHAAAFAKVRISKTRSGAVVEVLHRLTLILALCPGLRRRPRYACTYVCTTS